MTDRYFSVADLQAKFEEILDLVSLGSDRVFITDENGIPVAVLVPIKEYDELNRQLMEAARNI
jgi:prevent-host-death family protein